MSLLRKDNLQLKNALSAVRNRESKLDKSYATMTDRLRDITKSPIQEIRKMLLKLLE
jgi:Tfp pilus assembly protein PilX